MLTDRTWKLKYTPDGDSVELFAVSARPDAVRYDSLTGAAAPSVGGTPRRHRLSRCTWNAS